MKKTVAVGMSGGVDSSVSALLLKQQGYEVIGLFMKNWEDLDGHCPATQDFEDVAIICDQVGIPYYAIDFTKEYWDLVFQEFIDGLKQGLTPNPDILCNKEIKFNVFFKKAMELGVDYLATGHYAQNHQGKLLKGIDPGKDQSYFLYTLQEKTLEKVLFPIGGMEKKLVRKIAADHGLKTFDKKDSTGICFIGKRDFKEFMGQYIPYQEGNFETLKKEVVGKHSGAAFYTVGQRKGLGIGGPGDAWFVVGKNMNRNVVIVEQGQDHEALYKQSLIATELSWVNRPPSPIPFSCKAKIRYRQEDQECTITRLDDTQVFVEFKNPQRAVTEGQSIVFYDEMICLGGGIIHDSV